MNHRPNVRPKTTKFPKDNIGEKIHDIELGNDFFNITPKVQATKTKMYKWTTSNLKLYASLMKRQPME